MKITSTLLFAFCLHASAAGFSQQVTLNSRNATFETIFNQIRQQTGYNFLYSNEAFDKTKRITIRRSASMAEILNSLLGPENLTYRIIDSTILIKSKEEQRLPVAVITAPVLEVKGTITNEAGEVLAGATIKVKGSNTMTVADNNGQFVLRNIDDNAVLVVSYTGYDEREVSLRGRSEIAVQLKLSPQKLSEIVVVGYGTQKKLNLTGSVSSIKGEDFENRPAKSLSSVLQGQMAGVTVKSSTGMPGQGGSSIRIRGIGTLGDANPLYVVDGVPTRAIDILNPDDIESISVLKDAASASIYGVRGANGVILITTKKGDKVNGTQLAYNGYFGWQTPTALPEFVGSVDYMKLLNEAQQNVGQSPTYSDEDIEIARNGSDPNYFANTDWVGELFKNNAPQQSHNINLSGKANNINYYLSYGNLKEGGLVTGDNYTASRNNARLRINTNLFSRLDIDANLGYVDRETQGAAEGVSNGSGALYALHAITPLTPVRYTTGDWALGNVRNPIAINSVGGVNKYTSQELMTNVMASMKVAKGLTLRAQYALNKYNSRRNLFSKTINYYSPVDGSLVQTNQNKLTVSSYSGSYYTLMGLAEYTRTFWGDHDVKVLVGASEEKDRTDDFSASRTDLPIQESESIRLGTQNQLNSGGGAVNALNSAFGRLNYAFRDKYLAELNFRYDGSSRFDEELRYQLFSSGSAGWVFSKERFFEPLLHVVQSAKIRYSYGTLGNDKVGYDFAYMSTLGSVTTMPIGNRLTTGFRETGTPNRLLTWETAVQQSAGLDVMMLRGRLGITAEYFKNNTNDILLTVDLPDILGTSYPPQNAGKVENKGWEVQLSWRDKVNDWHYSARLHLSDVRNRVVSLGDAPATMGDQIRMVGHPIDAFYGLRAKGIAQEKDFTYDAVSGKYIPNFPVISGDRVAPGDIMYEDLDDDGVITLSGDRAVVGNSIPRYTYGLSGDLGWKAFDLSFLIQGVGKVDGYLRGAAKHAFVNIGNDPVPQTLHLDRWTPENVGASYPRLTAGQTHNQRMSTFWLEDASYLRLKNIQVGYTIPEHVSKRLWISRCRIYASAENLFTQTNFFHSYDPETPVGSAGGYYPQVKTFVFGLNINFK